MSRNEIVTKIYEKIDWEDLFNNCNITRNRDDLQQMIMLNLLEIDLKKLKTIYTTNTYKFYIVRFILNQRNGKYGEYHRVFRIFDYDELKHMRSDDYHEQCNINKEKKEEKITKVFEIMRNKTNDKVLNFALNLFHTYYIRKYIKKDGLTYVNLSIEMNLSRTTIINLITQAKNYIKEEYGRTINTTIINN